MNWGGKLIGGTLGMVALGPIGAAIGVFIGHQFDAGGGPAKLLGGTVFGPGADPREVNQLFFPTTFRVMGYIAKADGRVSEQEIASARSVMHALHLQDSQIQKAIGFFGEGKRPDFDLQASLRRLRRAIAPFPELGYFFVEIQLQAALAGNGLPPPLREHITWIATRLGVGPIDVARLESVLRFRMGAGAGRPPGGGAGAANGSYINDEQRMAQAYSVLEATPLMSDEAVVKCYRRQMSRHHPDKLKANGLPESMLERAKERAQQIRAAYELIRDRRGMR